MSDGRFVQFLNDFNINQKKSEKRVGVSIEREELWLRITSERVESMNEICQMVKYKASFEVDSSGSFIGVPVEFWEGQGV